MSRKGLTLVEYLVILSIVGIIAAIALPLLLTTPTPQQPQSAVKFEKVEGALTASCNPKTVETVGNHSWMPLYIDKDTSEKSALPSEYRLFILAALLAFEKEHPELEVTNWRIERDQGANVPSAWNARIYGLWIDHQPRKEK